MKASCYYGTMAAVLALSQPGAAENKGLGSGTRAAEHPEDSQEQHYPFQSRIIGGTVANAKNYEYHVNLGGCGASL